MVSTRIFLFVLLVGVSLEPVFASDSDKTQTLEITRGEKLFVTDVLGAMTIALWGTQYWGYGTWEPHFTHEGWFDADSKHGGADKAGHFYATYALSHIIASASEGWGYSRQQAALAGALSGFGLHAFMEWGDAFSGFGFSYQDFTMNAWGAAAAYLLYRYPRMQEYIDFRAEYIPTFSQVDIFTDYEGMKYLLAFKLDAFSSLRDSSLGYLEVHLGYYTRGYEEVATVSPRRMVYAGLGINVGRLFSEYGHRRSGRFFHYVQMPYTYIPVERALLP